MYEEFRGTLRQDPAVGAWVLVGHPAVAEVVAETAVDFVVVDGEHSENTVADLAACIRAVEATGSAAPAVRVSSADRAEIRRVLDLGPAGVVVPQIESLAEAEDAVRATRYPPDGVRGVAGQRASGYGRDLAAQVRGDGPEPVTVLQVETRGAVDDIEGIVAIDGLDGLLIGPADLSARLGAYGEFGGELFRDAVDRVVGAAGDADVPVGTLATTPENVPDRWDWGVDFLVTGTDIGYLTAGAEQFLDRSRDTDRRS